MIFSNDELHIILKRRNLEWYEDRRTKCFVFNILYLATVINDGADRFTDLCDAIHDDMTRTLHFVERRQLCPIELSSK